jgi:hypothetical protein
LSIKFIGPSEHLRDARRACQRSVNLFMSRGEGLGEDRALILASTPGLQTFLTLTGKTIRGAYVAVDRMFVVADKYLYEVDADATYVQRGQLLSTTGFVSMVHGRDQLVLVDGSSGYVMNLISNGFDRITDSDWRGSRWVEEMDGYFIFVAPDSDQFYLSQIDDATSLDALDFSSADAQQDLIVTLRVHKRELYLFGQNSTEVWVNSGDPDFPFVRYNSTPIDVGCVGIRAATNTIDSLIFVGRTEAGQGYVYQMNAHQPVRISTIAVETALAQSDDISQASLWCYHVGGAEFVAVNAPGMDTTWVYDTSTQVWHERGELVAGEWTPYRADMVVHMAGTHYACAEDKMYTVAGTSIAGTPLTRERTLPHLFKPSLEPLNYRSLELACATGEGGNITLEISNDGGHNFGPPLERSLGATGRFMQRVRWMWLGASRDRVFRLRCTDDIDLTIYSGVIDA